MSSQSVKPYYVWTCNSRKRYQCVKLTVSIRASQTCYCFKLHTALIESRNELSICQALRKHHRDLVITPQDPSPCATRDRNKNARKRKTKIGHGHSKESLDLALETAALGRGGGGYMRGGGHQLRTAMHQHVNVINQTNSLCQLRTAMHTTLWGSSSWVYVGVGGVGWDNWGSGA